MRNAGSCFELEVRSHTEKDEALNRQGAKKQDIRCDI
jgi:hypothetical protein